LKLEHSFTVPADLDTVWQAVLDPERVAPCMPGATVSEVDGDAFKGSVKVKLGPIALVYKGSGEFLSKDESSRTVVIKAAGKDARGNGTANATVTVVLSPDGAATRGAVTTDLSVTGKPAQLGRGLISEVGGKILDQFATCLASKLAPATSPVEAAEAPKLSVVEKERPEAPSAPEAAPTAQLPAEERGEAPVPLPGTADKGRPDPVAVRPDPATGRPEPVTVPPDSVTDGSEPLSDGQDSATDGQDLATDRPDSATDRPDSATDGSDSATDRPDSVSDRPDSATGRLEPVVVPPAPVTGRPEPVAGRPDSGTDRPEPVTDRAEAVAIGREAGEAAAEHAPPASRPKLAPVPEPDNEPIDLMSYAGPSVAKRMAPLAALAAAVVTFVALRRRRR
jgi:carbon monoxide dehydrogenase subunit G